MVSFYPGPSRIHDNIPTYVRDAAKEGILSLNHRSEEFMALSRRTARLLRQRLRVPQNYTIVYTSSATECWEIVAQSFGPNTSNHFFCGAFGQKWFDYTCKLKVNTIANSFDRETLLEPLKLKASTDSDVICITQNETSNGTQVANDRILEMQALNKDHLIVIDATSSMAGIDLDFNAADIWYASVQKCFGLPAGMAIMILSPKAVGSARSINERSHYNSLTLLLAMAEKWQTSYTPNVLGIYLLMRTLETSASIRTSHKILTERYNGWINLIDDSRHLQHLIDNPAARSHTVIPITSSPQMITRIKRDARRNGFLLGEGYAELKASTFRIANFPAIRNSEISTLKKLLGKY